MNHMDFATHDVGPSCCMPGGALDISIGQMAQTAESRQEAGMKNMGEWPDIEELMTLMVDSDSGDSGDSKMHVTYKKDDKGELYIERRTVTEGKPDIVVREELLSKTATPREASKDTHKVGDTSMIPAAPAGNYINRERYVTYVRVKEFDKLPRFVVDTPHFSFDSYGDTTGWCLNVKQRWYAGYPGKLSVRLTNDATVNHGGIQIRITQNNLDRRIETIEDVAELFTGVFDLVHAGKVVQIPRAIGSYTDEELLAEVSRRTKARLGDYRGPKTVRTVEDLNDIDNVIDFAQVRAVRYDEEKLRSMLVA